MKSNIIYLNSNQTLSHIKPFFSSGISSPHLIYHNNSLIFSVGNNIVIDSFSSDCQFTLRGHDNSITCITSHESGLMASGQLGSPGNKNYDSPVILWDINEKKGLGNLEGLKEGVKNLHFCENGKLVGGVSSKNQLIIWNTNSFQQIYVKNFQFPINILNFKADFITFLNSKMLQEIDLTPLFTLNKPPIYSNYTLPSTGLPRNYLCLAEVSDREYLMGTQSGEVGFFVKGVFKWGEISGKGKVTSILVSKQRKVVFVATDNEVLKYELSSHKLIEKGRKEISGIVKLVFGENHFYGLTKGEVILFNQQNLHPEIIRYSHSSRIVGVSSKYGYVATIELLGFIIVRSLKDQNMKGKWCPSKPCQGSSIQIASQNTMLAGFADGVIHCISLNGAKTLWSLNAHKGGVTCIEWGEDCVIRIWSSKTNQLINQLSVHQKRISSVLSDYQSPQLIHSSSIDKSIHTYDLKTDKKVNFRQGTNGSITSMHQLRNTLHLVTCGPGMGVAFWKQNEPSPYLSLQADVKVLIVNSSPNGDLLAIGAQNGNIYLFNIKKGYMGMIRGHSREITGLAWGYEQMLISVSDDHSVKYWKIA